VQRDVINLSSRDMVLRLAPRVLHDIPTSWSDLSFVDTVTAAQVQSAAAALLKSAPTVVTAGDVRGAPTSTQVQSW
jgi:hypothetical protein